MNPLMQEAQAAAGRFSSLSEDDLYVELGARLQSMRRDTAGSEKFDMVRADALESYGAVDELTNLGKKLFARWNQSAFDLICGSNPDDSAARDDVAAAFGLGKEALVASIAVALTAYFGLAAALAPLVASLAVRYFFQPTREAMCEYWQEKLGE